MSTNQLERWEQVTAEIEIRRWLMAHQLWAPGAEKLVPAEDDGTASDQVAPEPVVRLKALQLGQQDDEPAQLQADTVLS